MEQLNISSAQNRNILISFLLYLLLIAALIASITDLDILLNLDIELPFFRLKVSVLHFYIFMPLILVLFHLNILYNTQKHFIKLKHLASKLSRRTIYPYIINFSFLEGWLVKTFAFILIIGFTQLSLLSILISFIPFQIGIITFWHILLILVDFSIVLFIFHKHYFSYFSTIIFTISMLIVFFYPLQDNLVLKNIRSLPNKDNILSYKDIALKNLNGLILTRFQAHHLDFLNNSLSQSYITSSTITHSDFQFVDFNNTQIQESNMSQNNYYRVDFSHAKISDSDFSHSRFEIIDFSSATLTNVNLCHSSFLKITKDEKTTLENVQCVPQSLLP